MNLSELHNGQSAYIGPLRGSLAFKRRLEEMGFVCGQEVSRTYAGPFGTPIVYAMMGQRVALRKHEAELVDVFATEAEAKAAGLRAEATDPIANGLPVRAQQCQGGCAGCSCCGPHPSKPKHTDENHLTVALVGNPNCGKTAFFNAACGGHERTGNYAGVTVSSVEGWTTLGGRQICVIDLPGTYSFRAFSPEEAFVANELAKGTMDIVINVLDVTNLERNLLLTLQLKAMGLPLVGVLNMYDEFESSHSHIDLPELEKRLGIPLIPTVASHGRGVEEVLAKAVEYALKQQAPANSGNGQAITGEAKESATAESARSGAIAALQSTPAERREEIEHLLSGIYERRDSRAMQATGIIDKIMARTPLAYLLFFLIMGLIFYVTFAIGAYPMDWMDAGVAWLSDEVSGHMPAGWLRDLLVSGVLGGVGSVIVFLPNILILYFFISILEDSGYLARAAFLADPLLRRVGLHGKSFIPMLMGFGCNVPAVMATRTIESRKSRLITMMTLPFMSCSARLPVYTILAGAFFPEHAALVMLCLYAGGILVAFLAAGTLSHVFRRKEESHFVMEMPPYRMPVAKGVVRHTWEKGRQYLRKMGGIILIASIVVWALGYFPLSSEEQELTPAEQQEQSYLGQIGHALSPVIKPLGYDWRLGVGILSGVGAKELMVSTLGVLYNVPENSEGEMSDATLTEAIRHSGTTTAAAIGYLVFALLYFPCLATIAAIKGESGRWRYALFTAFYTTAVAYVMAFITYRIALCFM